MHFPGVGRAYELVCPQCARSDRDEDDDLGFVCAACFRNIEAAGVWHNDAECAITGQPEVVTRPTELRFDHEMFRLRERLPAPIVDIQPIESLALPTFVVLLADGELMLLDLVRSEFQSIGRRPGSMSGEDRLLVSPCGRFAAAYALHGQRGEVWDVAQKKVTFELEREPFEEPTAFPCGFTSYQGRVVLVHATEPSRIDAFDLEEQRLLTDRDPHTSDYVHGRLLCNREGSWIADGGRVPGPCGFVAAWNLGQWLADNPFESEDGPSKKYFSQRWRSWDNEMCWVAPNRLAVWGYGPDEACVLPAVGLYDVTTGQRLTWFPGPSGWLAYDRHLFSCDARTGTAVFDIKTGERLLLDPGFYPQRYHPGAHCFVSTRPDGEFFILSQLAGT